MISRLTIGATAFLASAMALACDYPPRPHIPDGATATKEQMIAARNGVNEFFTGVDEYLRCIEDEEKAAVAALNNPSAEELQERDEELNRAFDAANNEKVTVGELLNREIRAYNSKRKQNSGD